MAGGVSKENPSEPVALVTIRQRACFIVQRLIANPFIASPLVDAPSFTLHRRTYFIELAEFHDDAWLKKTLATGMTRVVKASKGRESNPQEY